MILDFLFRASDHQRILTPDELARYLSASSRSASGVDVTPDRAMMYATVFACVRVLAESVGQLPLNLYEQRGRDRVKAVKHPLYQVLHVAPNPQQTAVEWREWATASLALAGNAYSYINRVRGSVRELTPFAPGAVVPQQDRETGEVTYRIRLADGKYEDLPPREVLHLKLFSLDGLLGVNPVRYARESIGMGIAAEKHGAGLFARGAAPGGVLESTKKLEKPVQDRLVASWRERHEGLDNAHRVAVLEDGLTWKSIPPLPSKDAQWLEGRKYTRSEIAGIWRVPPHKIGDLERATFSNIEQQEIEFVVAGLMPYCTRIEGRIALQLLEPEERAHFFAKFNERGLLRGDMSARAEYYTRQLQNGALSPNEIRELEDMNPREGGDVYLTPSNMLIDGQPAKAASPTPPPAPVDDPEDGEG